MTDDEKPGKPKRERPKHLQLVDTSLDYNTGATPAAAAAGQEHDPGPLPETFLQEVEEQAQHDAAAVIGNAVMHAAMSWVACCQEKAGISSRCVRSGAGLIGAARPRRPGWWDRRQAVRGARCIGDEDISLIGFSEERGVPMSQAASGGAQ